MEGGDRIPQKNLDKAKAGFQQFIKTTPKAKVIVQPVIKKTTTAKFKKTGKPKTKKKDYNKSKTNIGMSLPEGSPTVVFGAGKLPLTKDKKITEKIDIKPTEDTRLTETMTRGELIQTIREGYKRETQTAKDYIKELEKGKAKIKGTEYYDDPSTPQVEMIPGIYVKQRYENEISRAEEYIKSSVQDFKEVGRDIPVLQPYQSIKHDRGTGEMYIYTDIDKKREMEWEKKPWHEQLFRTGASLFMYAPAYLYAGVTKIGGKNGYFINDKTVSEGLRESSKIYIDVEKSRQRFEYDLYKTFEKKDYLGGLFKIYTSPMAIQAYFMAAGIAASKIWGTGAIQSTTKTIYQKGSELLGRYIPDVVKKYPGKFADIRLAKETWRTSTKIGEPTYITPNLRWHILGGKTIDPFKYTKPSSWGSYGTSWGYANLAQMSEFMKLPMIETKAMQGLSKRTLYKTKYSIKPYGKTSLSKTYLLKGRVPLKPKDLIIKGKPIGYRYIGTSKIVKSPYKYTSLGVSDTGYRYIGTSKIVKSLYKHKPMGTGDMGYRYITLSKTIKSQKPLFKFDKTYQPMGDYDIPETILKYYDSSRIIRSLPKSIDITKYEWYQSPLTTYIPKIYKGGTVETQIFAKPIVASLNLFDNFSYVLFEKKGKKIDFQPETNIIRFDIKTKLNFEPVQKLQHGFIQKPYIGQLQNLTYQQKLKKVQKTDFLIPSFYKHINTFKPKPSSKPINFFEPQPPRPPSQKRKTFTPIIPISLPVKLYGKGRVFYDFSLYDEIYKFKKAETYNPLKEMFKTSKTSKKMKQLTKQLWS